MNGNKIVAAEFTAVPPVRDEISAFQKLQDAFNGTYSDAILLALYGEFNENLTLNRDISISLDGGYDGYYTINSGMTTVKGSLTIEKGTISINKVILQ